MYRIHAPFEVKGIEDKEIQGLGSTFGNVDLGGDIVLPGAFKRSLAEHREKGTMPAMLWQHDSRQIPGAWRNAKEVTEGLMLTGEFAETQLGRETRTLSLMGAVNGLSIGGMLVDFDFDNDGNRLIQEFDLWETSIVTFAMNPQAQIEAVKSQFGDPRTFERHLRETGCSKNAARAIVHDLYGTGVRPETSRCEAEDDDLLNEIRQANESLMAGMIRHKLRSTRNGQSNPGGNAAAR